MIEDDGEQPDLMNESKILAIDESNFYVQDEAGGLMIDNQQDGEGSDSISDNFILNDLINIKKMLVELK